MNDPKFTPGEWKYEIARYDCGKNCGMRAVVKSGERSLFGVFSEIEKNFATIEANAALVAAAPKMYKKLEELLDWFYRNDL